MRTVRLATVLTLTIVALAGCAAPTDGVAAPTAPAATSSASASPAPSPEQTAVALSLDGITLTLGGTEEEASLDDGEAVVSLLTDLTGQTPQTSDIEDPWGNGEVMGTRYEWSDVIVSVFDGRANLVIRSAQLGGSPVTTTAGIGVASSRADVLAEDGWDEWDEDGDGIAENLGLDAREVPGALSLSRPGSAGIDYISLTLSDDLVTEIRVPANDYSDL